MARIKPSRIDYCTGSPDRIGGLVFTPCCAGHDRAYELQYESRLRADNALAACMMRQAARVAARRALGGVSAWSRLPRALWGCVTLVEGALVASAYWGAVRSIGWMFWKKARPPLRRFQRRLAARALSRVPEYRETRSRRTWTA